MAFVERIHISNGGVPKLAVESTTVGALGLAGDAHTKPSHGGPERAVCLLAAEVIEALRAEGHPIVPGSTGENLTVRGLDWPAIVPGVRLRVGAHVELEITLHTIPCMNIAASFRDGFIARLSHERYPGSARLYARVLAGGAIRTGDPIAVLAG